MGPPDEGQWLYANCVIIHAKTQGSVTGRVCNQAPDSFLEADRSLTLDKGSGPVAKSSAAMEETLGRSHDFCRCDIGPEGGGSL